jgi:hypothetical protein
MRISLISGMVALTAIIALPLAAQAQNLVTNPGFETGNFTGWTQGGNLGFTGVTGGIYAHTGSFGAFLGPVGSTGSLTQLLSTLAGQNYTFSYWLRHDGGTPNSFQAFWDGVAMQTLANQPSLAYTQYSFSVVASSAITPVSFVYQQNPAYWGLDDVSVTASASLTPEMPGGALLLPALLPFGLMAARKRFQKTQA